LGSDLRFSIRGPKLEDGRTGSSLLKSGILFQDRFSACILNWEKILRHRIFFAVALVNLISALSMGRLPGEQRDLILVAGQSNAVGFDAYATELPTDPGDKDVLFWFRCGDPPPDTFDSTSQRQWTHLQPQPKGTPLARNSGKAGEVGFGLSRQYGNFAKSEGGFGPEIGLTRTLRKADPNTKLAVIKVAFSGTGMRQDWSPNDTGDVGACYRAMIQETQLAISEAKSQGIELRLRALIWVQGESDATERDAPHYQESLAFMIASLRTDLRSPLLPVLLSVNSRFLEGENPHVAKIVEAQKALAKSLAWCEYVDTSECETLLPRRIHFTAAGTLDVGNRFANAMLESNVRHSLFIAGPSFTGIIDEQGNEEWNSGRNGARDGYILPNGNALIAWSDEVLELKRDKTIVFRYQKSPENREIGTVQRIENNRTLITELGPAPKLIEVDMDGSIKAQITLEPETDNAHMQTRMARKLSNGNYLVPHLLAFQVKEYSPTGKIVRTIKTDLAELGGREAENWPFTAIRLESGNTLVNLTHGNKCVEFDSDGKVVWKLSNDSFPEKPFADPCGAQRLPNGNTVIASYGAKRGIKAFEVTRDGAIVWTYQGKHNIHELQVLTTNGQPVQGTPLK
jgi:hypothetical protein